MVKGAGVIIAAEVSIVSENCSSLQEGQMDRTKIQETELAIKIMKVHVLQSLYKKMNDLELISPYR